MNTTQTIKSLYVDECSVDAKSIVDALQDGSLDQNGAVEWINNLIMHNIDMCKQSVAGRYEREMSVLETQITQEKHTIDAILSTIQLKDEYLTKLACLGNGDAPGNSIGNTIAQEALVATADYSEVCKNAGRYCFIEDHVEEIRYIPYSVGGHITKWVFELRDVNGVSVAPLHASETLAETVDKAMRYMDQ